MSYIKDYFTEESTLGILINGKNGDCSGHKLTLHKSFDSMSIYEKIGYYLIIGTTRFLASMIFISMPILIIVLVHIFKWYDIFDQPGFVELSNDVYEKIGIRLNIGWMMLGDFLSYILLFLIITIPLKTVRLITSFIYYRKQLNQINKSI